MIGIVLIAHAHIASETKAAAEHILGKQTQLQAIDIPSSDATEQETQRFEDMLNYQAEGTLVMVDILGATPWNIARKAMDNADDGQVEILAGFSLPTVIKALSLSGQGLNLEEVAVLSAKAGKQYLCTGKHCQPQAEPD